jgi:hypothetical protein
MEQVGKLVEEDHHLRKRKWHLQGKEIGNKMRYWHWSNVIKHVEHVPHKELLDPRVHMVPIAQQWNKIVDVPKACSCQGVEKWEDVQRISRMFNSYYEKL